MAPRSGSQVALAGALLLIGACGSSLEPADLPYGARPSACAPGFRPYGDGACRPSNPCLLEDPCSPSRSCWNDGEGHATCGECRDGFVAVPGGCAQDDGPQDYIGPARAGRDSLMLWDGTRYRPRFLRGVDLGVGVPGETPGTLAIDREQYRRWFDRMREGGLDTIRVYTLHFPRFYEELRRHNLAHPEAPLHLIQGVWLRESATEPDHDLYRATEAFDAEIEAIVDAIHGAADVPERRGHGWGVYEADVSDWTIGVLVGREIFTREVEATDRLHAEDRRFEGEAFTLEDGNPSSAWMAARLDRIVAHDRSTYGTERPVAFSNWLELDPIEHPTEPDASGKDRTSIDLSTLDATRAPAGHFISFHVYPYYPHFVNEDPGYRTYADELGPNSYLGILDDLRNHYRGKPLIVAEYGVPSSWGLAKHADSGMHHGGHTEMEQGAHAARMLRNIFDTGLAGALYFHWMDGWFKRIWVLEDRTFPARRLPLWPDLTNPQQNYGLLAFDPEPVALSEPAAGEGLVSSLRGGANAEGVELEIALRRPLEAGERVTVGFDTYGDTLGASVLPQGVEVTRRVELALTHVAGTEGALLEVIGPYDLLGIPRGALPAHSLGRSVELGDVDWRVLTWNTAVDRCSDDGRLCFPRWETPVGNLRARTVGVQEATSQDAVTVDGDRVHVRVPFTFLQFTDPSRRAVFDDDPGTPEWDATTTEGVAFAVAVDVDGEVLGRGVTERIGWPLWDEAPATTERLKAGAETFFDAVRALPRVYPRARD
jgi:hypothetical protein